MLQHLMMKLDGVELYWSEQHFWVPMEIADLFPMDALGILSLPLGSAWFPIWL